jgi:hypothetical protein
VRRKTVDFQEFASPHQIAVDIANKHHFWEMERVNWLNLTQETRDFIFATDTRSTTANLGWNNSTHIPKLCQIRDNLHANYMAAVFPNDNAITFESDDPETINAGNKESIEAYMRNKLRLSDFRNTVSQLLLDWIDYGNCFVKAEFIHETKVDPITGQQHVVYTGPKAERISPLDITFDPTTTDFSRAPKVIRELSSLGDIAAILEDYPEMGYLAEVFDQVKELRMKWNTAGVGSGMDVKKNRAYLADGFGNFKTYFESDYVELLHYYGDIWDQETQTLHRNRHIVVVDRAYVIHNSEHPSWHGCPPIFHSGWRLRPDNLYAMGPLDNLLGMQYRIDHLENLKADAFDLTIFPVMKVRGLVDEFTYGPNQRIYVGDEGDVEFMTPDASVLSANNEIELYMMKMEEMAGAPRQAMGFRTPGEKTKFEVQVLENGANRVFLNKTSYFEIELLEPLLNAMLEIARRNFASVENVRVEDTDFNFVKFLEITKDDLVSSGNIRSVGARRFAQKANMLQDLVALSNSPLMADPMISGHFSSFKIAKMVEDLLEIQDYSIVQKNVRIAEQTESAQLAGAAEQVVMEEQQAGAPQQPQEEIPNE